MRSRTAEWGASVLVFYLMSGQGFRYALGVIGYGVVTVGVVGVVLTLLAREHGPGFWKVFSKTAWTTPLLWAFAAVAATTSIWSSTPALSFASAVVFALTCACALAVVTVIGRERALASVFYGLGASVILGLLFEVGVAVFISHPITPLSSSWVDLGNSVRDHDASPILWSGANIFDGGPINGFVGNRNPFGALALLSLVASACVCVAGVVRARTAVVVAIADIVVIALTRSATVAITLLFVILLVGAVAVVHALPTRWRRSASFAVAAVIVSAAVAAFKFKDILFALFDRSPDFTNRADIWAKVIDIAQQKPEGWGWVGGAWPVWARPYANLMSFGGNPVDHAHNAFLDVWLQTGAVGVILFTLFALSTAASTWSECEHSRGRRNVFTTAGVMLIAAVLLINGMTESRLLMEGHLYLLAFTAACSPPAVVVRRWLTSSASGRSQEST